MRMSFSLGFFSRRYLLERRRQVAAAICFSLFVLTGCASIASPESGSYVNGIYRNDYFGFTLPIPQTWTYVDGEAAAKAMNASQGEVLAGDESLRESLKDSIQRSSTLFVTFDNPADPRLAIFATTENIVNVIGVSSGVDYLTNALPAVAASVDGKQTEPISAVELGGREFGKATIVLGERFGGDRRVFLVTVIRGHALVFIVSAWDQASLAEGIDMLKAITFAAESGPAPLADRQIQGITGGTLFILGALGVIVGSLIKRRRTLAEAASNRTE